MVIVCRLANLEVSADRMVDWQSFGHFKWQLGDDGCMVGIQDLEGNKVCSLSD